LLAAVAATAVVQCLPDLPGHGMLAALVAAGAGLSLVAARHAHPVPGFPAGTAAGRALAPLLVAVLAFAVTVLRAQARLDDSLAPSNENKVSRVVLRVASLVRLDPDRRQFQADVLSSKPLGVPSRILVSWHSGGRSGPYGRSDAQPAEFPDLAPGQVWRMALTLKTPHGARNPHGFDYEGHVFAQGIRATGSVRGRPVYLRDEPWADLPVAAQRARHLVRRAMRPHLDGKRYGAVLLALAIGDQDSVGADDWRVFNQTGLTHLVSISGSHITMIAALGGLAVLWLWPRIRFRGRALAERVPAQVASAWTALALAWLYCLLAGWGVPARRTFIMLLVLACARAARVPLNTSRALCLVVFAVVALDPWALFASGFWLSFGAVYVLLASPGWLGRDLVVRRRAWRHRVWRYLLAAARLQLAITVGLTPLLALIFHQVSIASPVANAYAIPVIGAVVTPLSLLAAAAALAPGMDWLAGGLAWLGHGALALIMAPTTWLAGLGAASMDVPAAPWWLTLVAIAGLAVAVTPHGFPGRAAAWLLVVPALWWRPEKPHYGGWHLVALDVGQSSAIVVRTSDHVLVFDTGLRTGPDADAGERTVWPYMRAAGIERIDVLVVSHADIDHAGGVRSILSHARVGQSYSSFDLHAYLRREARLLGRPQDLPRLPDAMSVCAAGLSWHVDGVRFEFLWPASPAPGRRGGTPGRRSRRNDDACVLLVRGADHSALLTSDIGARQEAALVKRVAAGVDVVMAAHHGSGASSSAGFVRAARASHVIAQAGKWNRYGHPDPAVQKRWAKSGARFWRTDRHGALHVRSGPTGLYVESTRQAYPRYWQDQAFNSNK